MDKDQNQEEGFAGGEGDIEGTLPGVTTESDIQLERVTHKDLIKVLDKIEQKGYEIKEIKNSPFKKYKRFRGHKFPNANQLRYFYVYRIINTKMMNNSIYVKLIHQMEKRTSLHYYSDMKKNSIIN